MKHLAGPGDDRTRDVVFVHGLNGEPKTIWRNSSDELWPTWLADEFEDLAVWSLEYEARSSRWRGGHAMALYDRSVNLLAQMEARDLGTCPMVFVAHSMGGLMVKQMLRVASENKRFAKFSKATVGVVFLATPHSGSRLADVADRFRRVYRSTPPIGDLRRNNPALRELNVWYQNRAISSGWLHSVLREGYPTPLGVLVVDEESSNLHLPDVPCISVDADHSSIAKAESRESLQYREICRLLKLTADRVQQAQDGLSSGTRLQPVPSVTEPVTRVTLTMLEPALVLNGTTYYRDLGNWLQQRIEPGRNFGSYALPFCGSVQPPPLGGRVLTRILTDRWYTQPEAWITEDGRFNNRIYVDERMPPSRVEISVVDADGVEVNKTLARLE